MRRMLLPCLGLALLVAPAGATAQPTSTDQSNAAKECRSERGTTAATREAFRVKYGTNKNGKNAFGKCVSKRSRAEESQRETAKENGAKACKAERADDPAAFAQKYGTNKNGKNAYGKCVSGKATEGKAKADARDAQKVKQVKSAAKSCAAERGSTADSRADFRQKYGTNKSNAFGKCVSSQAKAKSNA